MNKNNVFVPYDVLIPKKCDMQKWSVIACDQYTSEPKYWENAKELIGNSPSTLNMILPEAFLNDGDTEEKIKNANEKMYEYLENDIFKTINKKYIYIEREVNGGKIRKGIIGAIDLECYDYKKGASSLIRATEMTVESRIPPRVEIRKNAPLEIPHVMLLINDTKNHIFDMSNNKLNKIYDFNLMNNSGNIKGYEIKDSSKISDAIVKVYNENDGDLLIAVGDGNHSLASAKVCWDNIKKDLSVEEIENHPARFALCELVNLNDDAMTFEPIHRIVKDCDILNLLKEFSKYYKTEENCGQKIQYVIKGEVCDLYINNPTSPLHIASLQTFLDDYLSKNKGEIDYIHGDDVVKKLSMNDNTIGFIVPGINKADLFPAVIKDGSLPRKTFSMGEAFEKRFYLECKKIK